MSQDEKATAWLQQPFKEIARLEEVLEDQVRKKDMHCDRFFIVFRLLEQASAALVAAGLAPVAIPPLDADSMQQRKGAAT